ncbi:MAG: SMC-Scp complex subunit ScpB [Hydrogenibacillus sp.]|nr:SMC-Scp complex subunit ScpB [Hydrogenibacillus sp.]
MRDENTQPREADWTPAALEALLFVAGDEGLTLGQLAAALELPRARVLELIQALKSAYETERRGLQILQSGDVYQLVTRAEVAPYITRLSLTPKSGTLSSSALETLAIIAYRQPITRAEIEEIRGVGSERAIQSLLEKGLIEECGRLQAVGRPILYGTTDRFLRQFGLRSLEDLPPLPEG